MQQSDAKNCDNKQKQQPEQNKLEVFKKKSSLLKRKKLPPTKLFANIDLKHVINVGDVCFVNEDSLRFPDTSEETLLKTLYHYKMISKVNLNNSYINIELKRNSDDVMPAQYFIERLKSFGDQNLAKIATHLENINRQFVLLKDSCPIQQKSFAKDKQESLLQNFIEKMEGKKYFLYFSEITPQKINMKNIVFSVPLLQALGCNLKNIAMDFLKYKHIFFEVFTTKKYKFFIDTCLENFTKLMENPDMSEEQKSEITSFIYDDEVIRTKEGPDGGIYQEISHAKVKWFSPHPSICCFEILQLDDPEGIRIPKLRKINYFQESKPQQQLNELRKIGIDFPLLRIEDDGSKTNLAIEADVLESINGINYSNGDGNHNKFC